jgi:hypothetical protein
MKKTMHPSPLCAKLSSTVLRFGTVLALSVALVAAQSRIIRPSAQNNSAAPVKRPHVATLRASDSPNGSRVALSSDQSLTNYEAYRRGDRFYVRIPAADMPRAEATRGRGFADVRTQRTGDSTVVSFRLQPGATAHVEQRSNRLEVVFTVPGGTTSASPTRETTRPPSNTNSSSSRKANSNNQGAANPAIGQRNSNSPASRNANLSATRGPASSNTNSANALSPPIASAVTAGAKPGATPTATPKLAGPVKPSATPAPRTTSASSPAYQPTPPAQAQTRSSFWSQAKERANYWILLAQLNPVPVAIGAGVLLLIIALLIFQRRRARGTRSTRRSRADSTKTQREVETARSTQPDAAKAESSVKSSIPVDAVAAGLAVAAAGSREASEEPKEIRKEVPAPAAPVDAARRERVTRVSEEVKNALTGGEYDESVIGSDDRETRRLVGAELLAALVGRNMPRRERALAAFMKHGYFDDATRDLRIAESANERAAAARRLSFVHDREATPHLIGALDDSAPDVRRAAVEALMDLRDPSAIGPLNSLMQTENDRKVPRTLIKHAIDACATSTSADAAPLPASNIAPPVISEASSAPADSEREVIEL